jgi:hypothetical protein
MYVGSVCENGTRVGPPGFAACDASGHCYINVNEAG